MKSFRMSLNLVLIAFAMSLLSMCGGDTATVNTACTLSTTICINYTGSSFAGSQSNIDSACKGAGGTVAASCSTTSKVGTCKMNAGQANEYVFTFYSPTYTATTAQSTCTGLAGQFTP